MERSIARPKQLPCAVGVAGVARHNGRSALRAAHREAGETRLSPLGNKRPLSPRPATIAAVPA
jgi:hypothetical protein